MVAGSARAGGASEAAVVAGTGARSRVGVPRSRVAGAGARAVAGEGTSKEAGPSDVAE